jgi:hypothetical protein
LFRSSTSEFDSACIENATEHFLSGPEFKPVRDQKPEVDEIFFKPPSRSTSWLSGRFNGTHSTFNRGLSRVTREWCFINYTYGRNQGFSRAGDSGSVIIDRSFNPIAILWGGDELELEEEGGISYMRLRSPLF